MSKTLAESRCLRVHIRMSEREDMPRILDIEGLSFEYHWSLKISDPTRRDATRLDATRRDATRRDWT